MTTIAEALIEVRADTSKIGSDIERSVDGRSGSKIGKALGLGITAAAGAVLAGGAFLKGAFDEAEEAAKIGRTTAAIIKSTGGAAKVSADEVGELSQSLSEKAGVDDEVIQSGANLLLTFKNVRNEVGEGADIFDRATAAAVDLSAAGFGSVESGSKMLGKALNDPLKGITALSRAGVTFTADQQDMIKSLVEGGKTLEAQKIVLKEVESQVGGVAAASASTSDKLKVTWGNVKETLGTKLAPIVNRSLEGVQSVLSDFADGNYAKGFAKIGNGIISGLETARVRARAFIANKLAPAIANGIGNIRADWRDKWRTFWKDPTVAMDRTNSNAKARMNALSRLMGFSGTRAALNFGNNFGRLPSKVVVIANETVGDIKGAFVGLPKLAGSISANVTSDFVGGLRALPARVTGLAYDAYNGISRGLSGLPAMAARIGGDIVAGLANGIRNAGSAAVSAAVGVAVDALAAAKRALGSNSPSKEFMKLGEDSGEGLAMGFERKGSRVTKAAARMAGSSLGGAGGIIGRGGGGAGGRLRVIEGRFTIDDDGAYFRGLAAEEYDDATAFAGTIGRMG